MCTGLAVAAAVTGAAALTADFALVLRGQHVPTSQLVFGAAGVAFNLGGFKLARLKSPVGEFWRNGGEIAAYANTVPLDVISTTMAGRELARGKE